ncbi:MAG: hypothetical protein H7Y59_17425 [Anaerolineales bacterium]|nr:hypothetical protein [Anaerolineales bacterium]
MSDTTAPKPFVFVLMPFAKEFDDIYEFGIKIACQEVDAYCERVDEQIFTGSILDRVYNQIAKADIIVSDMSGMNPNVFYETGYAHALGKQVILLTQKIADIPFDLKHYSHIVYQGSIKELKEELKKRVSWCIENPDESIDKAETNLEIYLHGKKIFPNAQLSVSITLDTKEHKFSASFAVHNASKRICDANTVQLGLITPRQFKGEPASSTIQLSKTESIHLFPPLARILPNAWQQTELILNIADVSELINEKLSFVLRIFNELGTTDIPYNLTIRLKEEV